MWHGLYTSYKNVLLRIKKQEQKREKSKQKFSKQGQHLQEEQNYEVLKKQSSYGLIHHIKQAARGLTLVITVYGVRVGVCVCRCTHVCMCVHMHSAGVEIRRK